MSFKKTDSDSATVHEIFQGEVFYRSPLFQRHYVWGSKELEKLWADIDTVIEESSASRFLGALVLKPYQVRTASKPQSYWIIDGQQRLTTFYLLILACVRRAHELGGSSIADDYVNAYLLQSQSTVKNHTKLLPTIPDLGQFKSILKSINDYHPFAPGGAYGKSHGALVDAFNYHLEEIDKRITVEEEASLDELGNLMSNICSKIEFVQINLADHHDANEVFNRLNDSGQPLEIIDLIRNEVFSLLSDNVDDAEAIYDSHWLDFEKSFDLGDDPDSIKAASDIRNGYFFPFALIQDSKVKKADIFNALSKAWKKSVSKLTPEDGAKKIIDDLQFYVSSYLAIAVANRPKNLSDSLWEKVLRLHRMPAPTTLYPYLMRLLKSVETEEVKDSDAIGCLEVIESFLVRRAFLGLEPTGLHAVFKELWRKAEADSSLVTSNIQTKTIEFPNDSKFVECIREGDLYHRKLCSYVLEEYERSYTKGDVLKTFPKITADHLMPQKRQGDWISVVAQEDHDKYQHTWANLVPLSDKANAEKGTKNWDETCDLLALETVFASTKHVLDNYEEWNLDTILERAEGLSEWAVARWKK
ncbi:DUF262 domain-containing protein [Ferrimonas balearica]|uniref:DUF262 domain-containing protein n=1 Tax=Ferrimonas balearica TaxID=44012 RepID=UPI001F23E67E|nr:DUF262 domain-containing protein [Ferrimonas balearica]MBY6096394.1 DUF262 domain-containing HNH endonuclease family protein [Ferrimonas balearica]